MVVGRGIVVGGAELNRLRHYHRCGSSVFLNRCRLKPSIERGNTGVGLTMVRAPSGVSDQWERRTE
jgi:hypothetical protein